MTCLFNEFSYCLAIANDVHNYSIISMVHHEIISIINVRLFTNCDTLSGSKQLFMNTITFPMA